MITQESRNKIITIIIRIRVKESRHLQPVQQMLMKKMKHPSHNLERENVFAVVKRDIIATNVHKKIVNLSHNGR